MEFKKEFFVKITIGLIILRISLQLHCILCIGRVILINSTVLEYFNKVMLRFAGFAVYFCLLKFGFNPRFCILFFSIITNSFYSVILIPIKTYTLPFTKTTNIKTTTARNYTRQ